MSLYAIAIGAIVAVLWILSVIAGAGGLLLVAGWIALALVIAGAWLAIRWLVVRGGAPTCKCSANGDPDRFHVAGCPWAIPFPAAAGPCRFGCTDPLACRWPHRGCEHCIALRTGTSWREGPWGGAIVPHTMGPQA